MVLKSTKPLNKTIPVMYEFMGGIDKTPRKNFFGYVTSYGS